ncbi:hypothetical protein E2A64_00690 [Pseudohoeflea suaedae]|uniref:Uncharacterized protein n=1 Tax=Pseudohoeflea suaedae TaxID=877384 RepID=A0A4R5PMH2_9HYPH|nr:hypothetical protein [Pseudohoeflea suaedae]TDH37697.1 hypothetical protein E2A64_00690 [Pseudohoeflea suaedae]
MGSIGDLIIRFIAIGFGYLVACLGAGISYVFLSGLVRPEDFGRVPGIEITFTLIVGVIGVSAAFGRAALLPAFLAIGILEVTARRDWLYFVVGGMLIGAATGAFAIAGSEGEAVAWPLAVSAVAGAVGGSVYWLFAGRSSGSWLPSERRRRAEQWIVKQDSSAGRGSDKEPPPLA